MDYQYRFVTFGFGPRIFIQFDRRCGKKAPTGPTTFSLWPNQGALIPISAETVSALDTKYATHMRVAYIHRAEDESLKMGMDGHHAFGWILNSISIVS